MLGRGVVVGSVRHGEASRNGDRRGYVPPSSTSFVVSINPLRTDSQNGIRDTSFDVSIRDTSPRHVSTPSRGELLPMAHNLSRVQAKKTAP